ncbi:PKD domain-containing protein [bacterium]|nr:PKD domain-containing protein [bacterium]
MTRSSDNLSMRLAAGLLAMLALCLAACSSGSGELAQQGRAEPHSLRGQSPAGQPDNAIQPAVESTAPAAADFSELEQFLTDELERLGTERNASAAPAAGTEVFTLQAKRVSDVNEQLNRIELSWTARLPGDYDGNGEVNSSDLVPLAIHWNEKVSYQPEEEAGGVAYWPAGDRDDDSVGSHNWTLSHIDGNADGLVGLADVTVIAQHWQERITGYRLYRHIPLLAKTELLPGPGGPQSDVTFLLKAARRDIRDFSYVDELATAGTIEYYVTAWDAGSGTEGQPGKLASYRLNALPQAEFSYKVGEGPEPYTVSFDASASSDWDGGIASYDWDLDGDGEFELADAAVQLDAGFMGGTSLVRLRVTDGDGASSEALRSFSLKGLVTVAIEPSESEAVAPHSFIFTPLIGGTTEVVQYAWYVDAQPEAVQVTGGAEPFEYTPEIAKLHSVRLRVLGTDGLYREADSTVQLHPWPSVTAVLDDDVLLAPADFTVRRANLWGASPVCRLLLDGIPQGGFITDSSWQFSCAESSETSVQLEVRDKFGNAAISEPVIASCLTAPYYTHEFNPEIDFRPYELEYSLDLVDPDGLVEDVRLSGPGFSNESLVEPFDYSGQAQINSGSAQFWIRMYLKQDLPIEYQTILVPSASMELGFSIDPPSRLGDEELSVTLDVTTLQGSPAIDYFAWDVDNDGIYEFVDQLQVQLDGLGPGSHPVSLAGFNEVGSMAVTKDIVVYGGDFDVAIIRNDGGSYDANLTALTADLDSLGLDWQVIPYTDSILADLQPHGHFLVLWYRGGPADAIEPRQETMWTTAEIDNYIAILEQGRPMLMMSQNNSKVNDFPDLGLLGGWEYYYDVIPLPYAVPQQEYRHCWASAVVTDDGTGLGAGKYFSSAPSSFNADFGFLGRSNSWSKSGENYLLDGSSGKHATQLSVGTGLQYTGIGYYDDPFFILPGLSLGLAPQQQADGYWLGHLSWGTTVAPYRDLGFWPNYAISNHGNTRHWVVGYPWAAVNITESEPPGMTRADMLQNIIGWLKQKYNPQF